MASLRKRSDAKFYHVVVVFSKSCDLRVTQKLEVLKELSSDANFVTKIHRTSARWLCRSLHRVLFLDQYCLSQTSIYRMKMIHEWRAGGQSAERVCSKIVPYTVPDLYKSCQDEVVFSRVSGTSSVNHELCSCGSGYPKKISSNFALLQPRD